jgi:hypothetical protein
VGKAKKPCQTAQEARQQRYELIDRLRRHGKNNPAALALVDRLDKCERRSGCMSGACPECVRILQRWFAASGYRFLTQLETEIAVVSIVPDDLGVPIGQLGPELLAQTKRRIERAIKEAGITTIIGGFDFSVNEHEDGEFEPYHQPQFWGFVPRDQARKAKAQLRKAFPKTDTTQRPLKILKWNGKRGALAYALKSKFARRVSYYRQASDDGLQHGCWNTRHRFLRVQQEIELMIALDQAGLDARLLMRGARIVRTANGPMIRAITKLTP